MISDMSGFWECSDRVTYDDKTDKEIISPCKCRIEWEDLMRNVTQMISPDNVEYVE